MRSLFSGKEDVVEPVFLNVETMKNYEEQLYEVGCLFSNPNREEGKSEPVCYL